MNIELALAHRGMHRHVTTCALTAGAAQYWFPQGRRTWQAKTCVLFFACRKHVSRHPHTTHTKRERNGYIHERAMENIDT